MRENICVSVESCLAAFIYTNIDNRTGYVKTMRVLQQSTQSLFRNRADQELYYLPTFDNHRRGGSHHSELSGGFHVSLYINLEVVWILSGVLLNNRSH